MTTQRVTNLVRGMPKAWGLTVLEVMRIERGITYKQAAERIDMYPAHIKALEVQTMKILSRIDQQPEQELFLQAFFKHAVVQRYMFALELLEPKFREYIDRFTRKYEIDPITSIEEKTEYGIELLLLEQKTYNALIKHSAIRTIRDLMVRTENEIGCVRQISPTRRDEINDKLLMWCLGQNIPIDYYAVDCDPDKPLSEIYPYNPTFSILLLYLDPVITEALTDIYQATPKTMGDLLDCSINDLMAYKHVNARQIHRLKDRLTYFYGRPNNR